ncbi:binding-protein-dependent transporters inner membrane component [Haloferax elongans ATCC BAA-1513]|uniref:Binding-protein-dependent transporters inner membrane component n=1 Tax=Haloferax elongans ATCC BAA-1513 TaxID=1230453 RepID=M0HRH8_HALEO|nr:ABC transporter permease [Haloferax elongans]ELZ87190.1 binding-protein-dependent transporters inner membrane component [Haloferax elongans ATCC BAA-1513]
MSTKTETELPLRQRIAENPQPALVWAAVGAVLIGVELGAVLQVFGALAGVIVNLLPGDPGAATVASLQESLKSIPTLVSRDVIPNQGYWDGSQYVGTFLGLSPAAAWAVRFVLVYAYAFAVLAWLWDGYNRFRRHYRRVDWTPRDDVIDRFRGHSWGEFGLIITIMFVVMAVFAPAVGPTTMEKNILQPYDYEISYFDEETESVETALVGEANIGSGSQGAGDENVGPMSYDDFGRFHPFGTATNGKDLFTQVVFGARISLTIATLSIGIAGLIGLALAMITAYYKGLADMVVVLASDSIQSLPLIMVLILMLVIFQNTWVRELYDGAVLIILIFSLVYWPFIWRAIRGPAFQVSEQDWIDAAKSFGQTPGQVMRKHMAPYVFSYMLIYASLSLGGIIISVAGLSYLNLGITAPTPEWGRLIADGQQYVASPSWHISFIPGVLITLVVTGLNAFGDGIRDAIDPQADTGENETAAAGGGGA